MQNYLTKIFDFSEKIPFRDLLKYVLLESNIKAGNLRPLRFFKSLYSQIERQKICNSPLKVLRSNFHIFYDGGVVYHTSTGQYIGVATFFFFFFFFEIRVKIGRKID